MEMRCRSKINNRTEPRRSLRSRKDVSYSVGDIVEV